MTERIIDNELRLIPYYRNDEASLPWYQDLDVCRQVDNREKPYDVELLHRMYDYLTWGGATSRRSRRSSSLENSTVWSIGSPVETATTSTRLLLRKPSRRNCVNLTQFLPLPQKQAFVSRLQSGTMSANPTLPVLKSSCAA